MLVVKVFFIHSTSRTVGAPRETLHPRNRKRTMDDLIWTCLRPRAMLKMAMDPMGGISLTYGKFPWQGDSSGDYSSASCCKIYD
ncbi:unnamed protein product [Allacma fusca]|uniref:Uncharacterized protein n=1 Tax=Allacma fusca TaxID=39272 RepID=A0A8J2NQF4_9HEXA|nr:unnamed protein product [Allacma fusca]